MAPAWRTHFILSHSLATLSTIPLVWLCSLYPLWQGRPVLVLIWPITVLNALAVIFVIQYTGRPDRFQRLRIYGVSYDALHDRALQVSLCIACLELASLIFWIMTLHVFYTIWQDHSEGKTLLDLVDMPYINSIALPLLSTIYAIGCHSQHLWVVSASHRRMRPAFECHSQIAFSGRAENERWISQTDGRRQSFMPALHYAGWTDMLSDWHFHYQFAQISLLPTTILIIALKAEFVQECMFRTKTKSWFGLLDTLDTTAQRFLLLNTLLTLVALLLLVQGTTSHFRELGLYPPRAFQALWCAIAIAVADIAQLAAYGYLSRTNVDLLLHNMWCRDGNTRGRPEILIAAHAALFASLIYSLSCQLYLLVCGLRAGRAIQLAETEQLIEL